MATAALWYQITLSQNKTFLLERMQQIIAVLSGQDDALSTRREHCGKKQHIHSINITQSGIFDNNSLIRPIKLDTGLNIGNIFRYFNE